MSTRESKPGGYGYESGRDLVIETCDRMRLARLKAGLEQEEIAEMLGVSSSTVSNWENGRTSVKVPFLSAWAQVTGFNMSSLVPPPARGQTTFAGITITPKKLGTEEVS